MTKMIKKLIVIILLVAITVGGFYYYHTSEMKALSKQLGEEQAQRELMDERIQQIMEELEVSETEKESLLDQIDELLVEEEVVFDSEAIQEEILEIGELATIEYRFTNVGTVDGVEYFKHINCKVPFSEKTAVVSMDGVIKVGVDVSKVDISVNEVTKSITVKIPEAEILSTELFEESMVIYVEEESLFSNLTLDDSSSIRSEIKEKAEQNAIDNGLLDQAHIQAGEIIRCLIEAIPSIKDVYSITVL